MKIIVGSKNPNKVDAVRDVFVEQFKDEPIEVSLKDVLSDIPEQPLSLDVTIAGAINRAKNSFDKTECDLSIGIEGGLIPVPYSHSGYMQCEACVIYDGKNVYLGLSGAFSIPKNIVKSITEEGINLSEASRIHGYTKDDYVGYKEGIVGILSKGMIDRKKYTEHAIHMALIHYISKEVFI
jgi:inosine/xanthosine triphosphatase